MDIIPILLLPKHMQPGLATVPLLSQLQNVLNAAYAKSYDCHPDIMKTPYIRLHNAADLPTQLGPFAFTVVLLARTDLRRNYEIIATASAKKFNQGLRQHLTAIEEPGWTPDEADRYELSALAVAPKMQVSGMGVRAISELERLINPKNGIFETVLSEDAPLLKDVRLEGADNDLVGIDLRSLRPVKTTPNLKLPPLSRDKFVLMTIRETGPEGYYHKRGFVTKWSGRIPAGLWGTKQSCTMVYMEKSLE